MMGTNAVNLLDAVRSGAVKEMYGNLFNMAELEEKEKRSKYLESLIRRDKLAAELVEKRRLEVESYKTWDESKSLFFKYYNDNRWDDEAMRYGLKRSFFGFKVRLPRGRLNKEARKKAISQEISNRLSVFKLLTKSQRRVFDVIISRIYKYGPIILNQQTLANNLGLSRPTVCNALGRLNKLGLIHKKTMGYKKLVPEKGVYNLNPCQYSLGDKLIHDMAFINRHGKITDENVSNFVDSFPAVRNIIPRIFTVVVFNFVIMKKRVIKNSTNQSVSVEDSRSDRIELSKFRKTETFYDFGSQVVKDLRDSTRTTVCGKGDEEWNAASTEYNPGEAIEFHFLIAKKRYSEVNIGLKSGKLVYDKSRNRVIKRTESALERETRKKKEEKVKKPKKPKKVQEYNNEQVKPENKQSISASYWNSIGLLGKNGYDNHLKKKSLNIQSLPYGRALKEGMIK